MERILSQTRSFKAAPRIKPLGASKALPLTALAALVLLAGCTASGVRSVPPVELSSLASTPTPQDYTTPRGVVAILATDMVGTPYRDGGDSPEMGFDCSGLVFYAYAQAGVAVPRTSQDLFRAIQKIALAEALPGDLVFFQDQEWLSHVGIYLGKGRFVHAPSSGDTVSIAHISAPYYQQHLIAVGRVRLIDPT